MPERICGFDVVLGGHREGENATGGDESSILVTSHGGSARSVRPWTRCEFQFNRKVKD
jgi:hypothetical protein